ncbi:hypothetical protein Pmani_004269 [Petrolisthes manimaculis]|uniref:Uncharacterized protein n=1 Tax=Petrolisthes manimaculis TaxID=1843537 RepID=A0AAE1UP49_9EUCA|nr:hypothetical protein Pmani_004269 [Petrolisthes manimaculis]
MEGNLGGAAGQRASSQRQCLRHKNARSEMKVKSEATTTTQEFTTPRRPYIGQQERADALNSFLATYKQKHEDDKQQQQEKYLEKVEALHQSKVSLLAVSCTNRIFRGEEHALLVSSDG